MALLGLYCGRAEWTPAAALCAEEEARVGNQYKPRWAVMRTVLALQNGDVVGAERAVGECAVYDELLESGRTLVKCMKDGDGEGLAALQRSAKLNYLEACVVRVYKGFKVVGGGGKKGHAEEVDLT